MITTLVFEFLFWLIVESEEGQNFPIICLAPLAIFDILLLIISIPLDIILFPIEVIIGLIYLFIRKE